MKPVILLVDDEEEFIQLLRDAIDLSLPRYRAVICTSAEQAQQQLASLDPRDLALVCVDQRLRGQSGLTLLSHVRQQCPRVPAVLFTGQATPREGAQARAIGARVLWKPLRLSAWVHEIRSMLTQAHPEGAPTESRGLLEHPSAPDSLPLSWRPYPT
ncbi:MAG: response regulator [Myxococcales bacterium]|nr:response regulator [Myxococcales bacterium]